MRVLFTALFALSVATTAALAQGDPASDAPKPAATPPAVFTPAPSGWYVELRGGFATQQYDDLDGNLGYMEDVASQNLGAPGPLRRFDRGQSFGVEFGRRRGAWAYGIVTEHQRQRVHTFVSGTVTGALDAIALMSTMDVRLTGSYRPAALFGFEVGASAGLSFAHYSEQFALYVFPAPEFNLNYSGAYHAASLTGGPHLGWRRPLVGDTWLVARGAWLYRNFDELKGQYKDRQQGEATIVDSSLLRLADGELASVDASGFQATLGVSHTFGARR